MPNTILTPDIIAREALMVLRNNAVMANLVHRNYSSEFVAGVGDTITIRKPATFDAKVFNTEIEIQEANETGVPVTMDTLLDVSFAVTSREMTLDIADFSEQFLVPAMQAFNDKIDQMLLAAFVDNAANNVEIQNGAMTPTDIVAARQYLNAAAAPLADRHLVVDTVSEAALLTNDLFVSAERVGDDGTALREASLGRKFGFDIYMDQNADAVAEQMGNNTMGVAFHRNAVAFVTRPLALPQGAGKAAIVNYDGFGLRVVYGYDIKTKTDTVSIDMLTGIGTLNKDLAVMLAYGVK